MSAINTVVLGIAMSSGECIASVTGSSSAVEPVSCPAELIIGDIPRLLKRLPNTEAKP